MGLTASAKWAKARASRASVLANCPVALAKSRAWRGLTTHRQARRRQGRHPSSLIASCGFEDNQGGLQSLESLHQGGNPGVIVSHDPRSPVGRRAISSWALATSIPTKHCGADIIIPRWPGLAKYGLHGSGQRFGLSKEGT